MGLVTEAEVNAIAPLATAFSSAWREQDAAERLERSGGKLSFRAFLESPDYVRPSLEATGHPELSDAILAVVDASEGVPVTCSPELCWKLFHCDAAQLPTTPPNLVAGSIGGRSGKTSRLLAPKALHAALFLDLPTLAHQEHALALIVAPKKKLARKTFRIVLGIIDASPVLRKMVVGKPRAFDVTLKRDDGKFVDIEVGVADEFGGDARGSPLVFLALDEASFFRQKRSHEGVDKAVIDAAEQRLVPGAQIWIFSTPWIEGVGMLEQIIEHDWGKHEGALVVARVDTRTFNPNWDPDHVLENKIRARAGGDEIADREIWALPLPKGRKCFFAPHLVERALDKATPINELVDAIGGGADLAFVHDASSLAVIKKFVSGIFAAIALNKKRPDPRNKIALVPSTVYNSFAQTLRAHDCGAVAADPVSREDFREVLARYGIGLMNLPNDNAGKNGTYSAALELMNQGRLCLRDIWKTPEEREDLADQFATITKRPIAGPGNRFEITAPRRGLSEMESGEVAPHADDVSAIVAGLWAAGAGTGIAAPVEEGVDEEGSLVDQWADEYDDGTTPLGYGRSPVGWG